MGEETPKTNTRSHIVVIRKQASEVWWILPMICAVGTLLAGAYLFFHLPNKINADNSNELLSHIETIGVLTNAADVAALTGTNSDLTSDVYTRAKQTLYNIHDVSSGARDVYYMRLDTDGKFVFLADSERAGSTDSSLPGKINDKLSSTGTTNLLNAVSFTEGPYTDDLGTWVSGYSPIWYQGKLVGIIGMDIDASGWVSEVNQYRQNILIITLLIVFIFGLFGIHIRRLIFSYSTRGV